jgi:hypothetical protein
MHRRTGIIAARIIIMVVRGDAALGSWDPGLWVESG